MNASTTRRSPQADEGRRESPRPMHISLRAGERLFLNGAVLRVDRKVTLELLNDATFLLENHVLQVDDTKTPIRQLYFAVQAMLMDPANAAASRTLFEAMAADVASIFRSPALKAGIQEAMRQVMAERPFHALKTLRGLFAEEADVLAGTVLAPAPERPKPLAEATKPLTDATTARSQGVVDDAALATAGEPRRAAAANLPSH
ncbi:flagellar biosynthesis repressor FlbT [Acuticoccus sediminis]|uniref:flagellar biosynthesis repressor FlbT n=1 Tax=Acuticoccus sediminis TaxID=2184697 RepID=UPI001CFCFCD7|nr:flagellar biosynthesis repressor FlbT [Acuticoccus sediminis]